MNYTFYYEPFQTYYTFDQPWLLPDLESPLIRLNHLLNQFLLHLVDDIACCFCGFSSLKALIAMAIMRSSKKSLDSQLCVTGPKEFFTTK